jgi:hypothetical protein
MIWIDEEHVHAVPLVTYEPGVVAEHDFCSPIPTEHVPAPVDEISRLVSQGVQHPP